MRRRNSAGLAGLLALVIIVAVAVAAGTSSSRLTQWGGVGALFYYSSLGQWRQDVVAQGSSTAVVRVTGVSDLRWSTASGTRPDDDEIAMVNRGEATFGIGRLIATELVRTVDGSWPRTVQTASYFLPGGQIGNDVTPSLELVHHLPAPTVGDLAFATILPQPDDMDDGAGELIVEIGALFPVSSDGRLLTPNHAESLAIEGVGHGR